MISQQSILRGCSALAMGNFVGATPYVTRGNSRNEINEILSIRVRTLGVHNLGQYYRSVGSWNPPRGSESNPDADALDEGITEPKTQEKVGTSPITVSKMASREESETHKPEQWIWLGCKKWYKGQKKDIFKDISKKEGMFYGDYALQSKSESRFDRFGR